MNQADLEKKAEALIEIIRRRPDHTYNWDRLADQLLVDHNSLQQVIEQAAAWEYKLRVRNHSGVSFVAPPDLLNDIEIRHGLSTRWIGRTVFSYRSVKSTNDIATQRVGEAAPEGSVVTAEEQTKGRGRLGRVWHSPPSSGAYLSIILRPPIRPEDAPGLSVMTAVALADTLSELKVGLVQIKWPNDVWINGRKTAGILTELSAEKNKINHVVIGVGINVNNQTRDFPAELQKIATSVRRELRRKVDRIELVRRFLENFESEYQKYLRYRLKKSHPKIRRYSALIGHEITLAFGDRTMTGRVKDIDRDGALVLETATGMETITAGEVTVVKE